MGSITEASVSTESLPDGFSWVECNGAEGEVCDDTREPSLFFMVHETGLTSVYDAGEVMSLNLFYSRAVDWEDDYLVWTEETDTSACLLLIPKAHWSMSAMGSMDRKAVNLQRHLKVRLSRARAANSCLRAGTRKTLITGGERRSISMPGIVGCGTMNKYMAHPEF